MILIIPDKNKRIFRQKPLLIVHKLHKQAAGVIFFPLLNSLYSRENASHYMRAMLLFGHQKFMS